MPVGRGAAYRTERERVALVTSLVLQLEKVRLRRIMVAVPKVAQTHANQPIALLWTQIYSFSQLQGDFRQFFAGGGRGVWRMTAGLTLELTGLQFENHRTCNP